MVLWEQERRGDEVEKCELGEVVVDEYVRHIKLRKGLKWYR